MCLACHASIFFGVPHGSIIGPLLFIIHFNATHTLLQNSKIITCADDTVIFVSRNALRTSPNTNIQALWKNTRSGMNLQYDIYRNTKDVLKAVKSDSRERLAHQLLSQGAIISFLLDHSLKKLNGLWSVVQSNLPTNIFNFTIKYLNNILPTRKNLSLWNLSQSSDC